MESFFHILQWAVAVAVLALALFVAQRLGSKGGNSLLERLLGTIAQIRINSGTILLILILSFVGTIIYNLIQAMMAP